MIRRANSGLGMPPSKNNAAAKPSAVENNAANIFKQDEQEKPRTPGFRGGNDANKDVLNPVDMWP